VDCCDGLRISNDGAQVNGMANVKAIVVGECGGVVEFGMLIENGECAGVNVYGIVKGTASTTANEVFCVRGRDLMGCSCRSCVVGLCRSRHRHAVVEIVDVEGVSDAQYHDG
jgi:hypothetical protein